MSQLSIALDIVVAVLLVATIAYATVLNRKLAVLRNTKQEMETLINRLIENTEQAERGLAQLKAAAGDTGSALERKVEEAKGLSDDLGFMVDKANALADRLETQIGKARETVKSVETPSQNAAREASDAGGGTAGRSKQAKAKPRVAAHAGRKPASHAVQSDGEEGRNGFDELPPANAKLLRALRGVR